MCSYILVPLVGFLEALKSYTRMSENWVTGNCMHVGVDINFIWMIISANQECLQISLSNTFPAYRFYAVHMFWCTDWSNTDVIVF